jgi:glucan phosphorylase
MHLGDVEVQERLESLYVDSDSWVREAIVNVATSLVFSSDRIIVERANDVRKRNHAPFPNSHPF